MSQNDGRALGVYDEGKGLLSAMEHGESGVFSAATMAKLHNGASWSRDVNKDTSQFDMPRTCLGIATGFHLE